jgi:hypothetical protein
MHTRRLALLFCAGLVSALLITTGQAQPAAPATNAVEKLRAAAQAGEVVFRLTTPDGLKALLGPPKTESSEPDGDGSILTLEYPRVEVLFRRLQTEAPYTLFRVVAAGKSLDIGQDRMLTLRTVADLAKLDTFWGVAGVSLAGLDLTGQMARLNELPFDSRTEWPPADKLPKGFDPAKLLEDGKNPGLGVRGLHKQGIDGRGIHLVIIDQPLLREHREYKARVVEYTAIDVEGVEVQMHGSPVTSIAVGQSCGTAPGASVHYYAVPTWKWWEEHCKPYAATLERILQHNQNLPAAEKVRVVSISLGAFSQWPDRELWTAAVQHAESEGILVVTCDPAELRLMMLKRKPGLDADAPTNYVNQFAFRMTEGLGVPAGNRTTAEHTGPEDYVFWRNGGMSWTVPYLAGLGALAFQVDPELKPQTIRDLWLKTATRTSAGWVVNPPAFIDAVRAAKAKRMAGADKSAAAAP